MSQEVLVLNSDYEPLNICNMRRAIVLVFLGKVDVLHQDDKVLHAVSNTYQMPSVVRLRNHIRRPAPQLKLSRRSIFARDHYTCQYCGHRGSDLTIDHVIPKRLGGPTTWDNLVCCCKKCNGKKGAKTLAQLGYTLPQQPRKPKYVPLISYAKFVDGSKNEVWRDYLPAFKSYGPDAPLADSEPVATAAR
jgi:5-methylcytosine-specific restriction endonuclease McrA